MTTATPTLGETRFGYLRMPSASLSFAEIPTYFTSIFGVTGSLGDLPPKQLQVLRTKVRIPPPLLSACSDARFSVTLLANRVFSQYNVNDFSYFPSFWEHTDTAGRPV
jgi:hypothetical protein